MEQNLKPTNDIIIIDNDDTEVQHSNKTLAQMVADAEEHMTLLTRQMELSLRITTGYDWTVIGGRPYLQESGATKVAKLFSVSWKILKEEKFIDNGYPAYKYTMEFRQGATVIEAIGSRTGKDEFFAGKGDKKKSPDEICDSDVEKAAYTNCLNRGIKALLPGLKNIELETLEKQGIKPKTGYTFKEGSKGGKTQEERNEGLTCAVCGKAVSQKVASFSQSKFGRILCMDCQKKPQAQTDDYDDGYIPEAPPEA